MNNKEKQRLQKTRNKIAVWDLLYDIRKATSKRNPKSWENVNANQFLPELLRSGLSSDQLSEGFGLNSWYMNRTFSKEETIIVEKMIEDLCLFISSRK